MPSDYLYVLGYLMPSSFSHVVYIDSGLKMVDPSFFFCVSVILNPLSPKLLSNRTPISCHINAQVVTFVLSTSYLLFVPRYSLLVPL